MKANELEINDWVLIDDKPARVIAIPQNGVTFNDGKADGVATIEHVSPVYLTSEILKKNGFICDDRFIDLKRETTCIIDNIRTVQFGLLSAHAGWKMAWREQDCETHIYKVDGGEYYGRICFVHQLQHALRLCGIEKDIVL